MVATLVNAILVVIGGLIGVLFKKKIKEETCNQVLKAVGVAVVIFGILGIIKSMVIVDEGVISVQYELLLIISLALGTLIGELLKIDNHMNRFANYIETQCKKDENDTTTSFSAGFTNATIVFCVGAMAIVGAIDAGLGNETTIYLKAVIDGITAIVLASTLGFGVIFSSIIVLIYQGLITLLAMWLGNFLATDFINMFSAVGYAMVLSIGINFLATTKIKVSNMLPSLLIVIIYYLIKVFIPF